MADHVDAYLALARDSRRGAAYVLKKTIIPDGSMKGQVVIEVVADTGFRFLDLSAELRDHIYRLVLVKAKDISLSISYYAAGMARVASSKNFRSQLHHPYQKWIKESGKWTCNLPSFLSLLAVNKQIHNEATPIAYAGNIFRQDTSTALAYFRPMIRHSIQHLTSVDFGENCTWSTIKNTLVELRQATGLRRLIFAERMLFDALRINPYSFFSECANASFHRGAKVMSRDLRLLLPVLRDAYKASGRTWDAADVPHLRPEEKPALKIAGDKAQELMKVVRKLNEKYL